MRMRSRSRASRVLVTLSSVLIVGCGGGGGAGGSGAPASTYTIGGTVTGLTGSGLVLQNNGGDDLSVSADGIFVFSQAVTDGGQYAVSVAVRPGAPDQSCDVVNGSGTVAGAHVTDVVVTCADTLTALHVATNQYSTCALLESRQAKCWGRNAFGQLGQGDQEDRGDAPNEMGNRLLPLTLHASATVSRFSAGGEYNCALLDNGEIKCWGYNNFGQLGLGDTDSRGDAPGEMGADLPNIDLGTGRSAVQVAAGFYHACALLDNAEVKCWGRNDFGELGLGDTDDRGDGSGEMGNALPPVDLGSLGTPIQLAAGSSHTCALLDNGQVKCWGLNEYGQLGLGDDEHRGDEPNEMGSFLPTVDLGTGRSAVQLVAGHYHTCALLDNEQIKCWGRNFYGQLGLGDTDDRGDAANEMGNNLPQVAVGGINRTVSQVAAGAYHTCVVLDNGRTKCWGLNSTGQLGQGDVDTRGNEPNELGTNLPAIDVGGATVLEVTAGSGHTCVRLNDGSIKCWGDGSFGQLGLGDASRRGDAVGEMGNNLPAVDLGAP